MFKKKNPAQDSNFTGPTLENPSDPRLNKALIRLIILFGSITVMFALTFQGIGPDPDTISEKEKLPAVMITAPELYQSHRDDQAATAKRFGNLRFGVEGVLAEMGQEMFSKPYVLLATGSDEGKVRCDFFIEYKSSLTKLPIGEKTIVVGKYMGDSDGNVLLDACELR
jgi:hypothetical protein